MPIRREHVLAFFLSVVLHVLVLVVAGNHPFRIESRPQAAKPEQLVFLQVLPVPPQPQPQPPTPVEPAVRATPEPAAGPRIALREQPAATTPSAVRQRASMEAPPAPTAQEWALAARYTPKNSKRYRYTWGQQVRSMMGTAVEGPDQGAVRFLVEIAPDGTLARLQTLWTTSAVAERLARQAIERMPPLPPTPTGLPLIFEKTILFDAFSSEAPPIYANDCVPDPPAFESPFTWDGKSPQVRVEPKPVRKPNPQELADCLKQLTPDSIEAESAHNQRQFDLWDSSKLGR